MNFEIHLTFKLLVSPGYMPISRTVESYGNFISSFLSSCSVLIVAALIYISNSVKGSLFPISTQHLLFVDFFDDGHSYKGEMIPYYNFDLCK